MLSGHGVLILKGAVNSVVILENKFNFIPKRKNDNLKKKKSPLLYLLSPVMPLCRFVITGGYLVKLQVVLLMKRLQRNHTKHFKSVRATNAADTSGRHKFSWSFLICLGFADYFCGKESKLDS